MSALLLHYGLNSDIAPCPFCAAKTGPIASQQRVLLFDHLIGRSEQRRWDLKTERLGSFEINGKLEFGWLLYRQITWLGALQNLVHGCSAAADRSARNRQAGD